MIQEDDRAEMELCATSKIAPNMKPRLSVIALRPRPKAMAATMRGENVERVECQRHSYSCSFGAAKTTREWGSASCFRGRDLQVARAARRCPMAGARHSGRTRREWHVASRTGVMADQDASSVTVSVRPNRVPDVGGRPRRPSRVALRRRAGCLDGLSGLLQRPIAAAPAETRGIVTIFSPPQRQRSCRLS
jgi:hypothetical protein